MTTLKIKREDGRVFSHVRQKWLVETPEEKVRQEYLLVLVNEYGYTLDQIAEEKTLTGKGTANARADFVVWRTPKDKSEQKSPLIIVECKSDNVTITEKDYGQGENYARMCNAPLFVTHNSQETKYWRVKKDKIPGHREEIANIPQNNASEDDIKEILKKLRVFREKEFADLLHRCHNIIRDREAKDPAAAFDEIAKVLFIKIYVERQLLTRRNKQNIFTVKVLEEQLANDPLDSLFQNTKEYYSHARIFGSEERINLKPDTGTEIVRELEKYNLSDTSEDVKGVAFEKFLGRTFRGEIGQFFTPRGIVEFMVQMIDPKEGEIICDPASGSGGFLIRVFETVRAKILADADQEYKEFKTKIEKDETISESERAEKLFNMYRENQKKINPKDKGSKIWNLANRCIYGTDANDRMARTSKMNMIMHGDGHGGVHHHDGFLNIDGIFEGRFDIILTNPPFGSRIDLGKKILETDIQVDSDMNEACQKNYGKPYISARKKLDAKINEPFASLYALPKKTDSKVKTEVLFIERCLDLLKPGGRLGIVLPESIFNAPSLRYVRDFVESRAFIRAVVGLPQETFKSAGADVKCSLLFLQKFSKKEKEKFDTIKAEVAREVEEKYADVKRSERTKMIIEKMKDDERDLLRNRFNYLIFMYDASRVGITATGDADENELYQNPEQPADCQKTCLEYYREFQRNPDKFANSIKK